MPAPAQLDIIGTKSEWNSQIIMSSKVEKWIGSDESGKGDYFGPLVIASELVDISIARLLEESGVKDSKRLSDRSIKRLAADIKRHCLYSIVGIGPEK